VDEPFQTPQQLLRLLDIGSSDFHSFVDGQPITATDEEALLKILFRMPQISSEDISRWIRASVPWALLTADPGKSRGKFFLLHGRVRRVVKVPVRPQLAELFEMNDYWQVDLAVSAGSAITVYTRSIPTVWETARQLDEHAQVRGMFLKQGPPNMDEPTFLFAAPRIAWLPDQTDASLGIGPDQVLLAQLGMDVGLLDIVRSRNNKPISAAERECFYAMLQAAGRAAPQQLSQHASDMQLAPLLQQPQSLQGDVLRVRGSVRRITRVLVQEQDVQRQYGITAYYQLDVLVPLGNTEVAIQGDQAGGEGPVYRSNFPFTCCTLAIPAEWESLVGKQRINVAAVLEGFFLKIWAYSNPYVASFDERQRQLSPMLILHRPTVPRPAETANRRWQIVWGAAFLTLLITIWGTVWWLNHTDRERTRSVLQKRLDSQQQPDFRDWDTPDS
jgi:hypothetical protein